MASDVETKIVVLYGGNSSEREISLTSGKAVFEALKSTGANVRLQDIKALQEVESIATDEIVLPILHGGFGENGELQKALEDRGIAYAGSNSEACAIMMNKPQTNARLAAQKLPVPTGITLTSPDQPFEPIFPFPWIVKPANGGSTVGLTLVEEALQLKPAIQEAFSVDNEVLIERFFEGKEFSVSILNDEALLPVEIQYPDKLYDYDAKYTHQGGETHYHCPPISLSDDQIKSMQTLAKLAASVLQLRDFGRVDILCDTETSIMCVLEANNLPGMTSDSLLPKAAKQTGISFPDLCLQLVEMAQSRQEVL
ncbi:MAG: D-alanine--D-alanine ligase [Lentisphaeria bacterium]|nr:D-alanine--D-alanine ligase [Lentisphaeria bacterium]